MANSRLIEIPLLAKLVEAWEFASSDFNKAIQNFFFLLKALVFMKWREQFSNFFLFFLYHNW